MAELEVDTNPDAMTVQEVIVGLMAVAAGTPPLDRDRAHRVIDTVNAWRKVLPACEAVAAQYGVTVDQPIGWNAASRIVAEANVFVEAELEATR